MSSRRDKKSRDTAGSKKSQWDPSVEDTTSFSPEPSTEDYSISRGSDQSYREGDDDLASFANLNLGPQQASLQVVDPDIPVGFLSSFRVNFLIQL